MAVEKVMKLIVVVVELQIVVVISVVVILGLLVVFLMFVVGDCEVGSGGVKDNGAVDDGIDGQNDV